MGRSPAGDVAARIRQLSDAVRARASHTGGPVIGDLPHGDEIVRQLSVFMSLEGSTDRGDAARLHLATLRVYALMPREGHPEHPTGALLGSIVAGEDAAGESDARFWEEIGGRAVPNGTRIPPPR